MGKSRRVVKEATNEPDAPLDKALFDEKPKSVWKGKDGGDIRVEKAKWKADKTDRKVAKRRAVILKNLRKDQLERKRFKTPVKSMYSLNKEAIIRSCDGRRRRHAEKGLVRLSNKSLEANGQGSVIVVVKNHLPFTSRATANILSNWGLKKPWMAAVIPNTAENVQACHQIQKYVFYGCPSTEVLSDAVLKRGSLWKLVDEATVDLFEAHKKDRKASITDDDLITLNDNTEIESRMGYLDVLCFADLITKLVEGDEDLPTVLKHVGPMKLHSAKRAAESRLEDMRFAGWMRGDEFDGLLSRLV